VEIISKIKRTIRTLPNASGVYLYYDKKGKIIYVGKAIDIRKRVSSYFNNKNVPRKTQALVDNIYRIDYIVVENEQDALLLENNLIKRNKPKYNILLKDDKTYPWICIKNEPFPRILKTRKIEKDGSLYFGPFTSGHLVNTLIDLFRQSFQLRTCKLNLSNESVSRGKFKVCLQFHIGNCLGPCDRRQNEVSYLHGIDEIKKILNGNIHDVIQNQITLMNEKVEKLYFEEAQIIKNRIDALKGFTNKSTVVSSTLGTLDVYSFLKQESNVFVNYLRVINGCVLQSFTLEIKEVIDETDEDLLMHGIIEIRTRIKSSAKQMIVPFDPLYRIPGIKYSIPKIGEKRKLLELSQKNLFYYLEEKKQHELNSKKITPSSRILQKIQEDLQLKEPPVRIECFDNSNIQGSDPVAACVVFKNANPSKRDYRIFNVKTVDGPNDFASMKEVVFRRYKRLLEERQDMPQLIVVDGGKGQLNSAVEALRELSLYGTIPIIGIAKRLEEIYFPNDPVPIHLNKNSETLKLIQRIRDEAHRFGISHHRTKRISRSLKSELDEINGIGSKTKELLFITFKSVDEIKKASLEEIILKIGNSKGEKVYRYFKNQQHQDDR
jgi:excinuclease ABC subunit C